MSEDDGNIVKLEGASKPVDQRGLRLISYQRGACDHRTATFIVDEALEEVQCGDCGAKLSANWALRQLCEKESRWRRKLEEYRAEVKDIKDRTRTKCVHCEQMTPIRNSRGKLSVMP